MASLLLAPLPLVAQHYVHKAPKHEVVATILPVPAPPSPVVTPDPVPPQEVQPVTMPIPKAKPHHHKKLIKPVSPPQEDWFKF